MEAGLIHCPAMKNIHRILCGLLSSMLFSVGLVRAADSLDPLGQSVGGSPELGKAGHPGGVASSDPSQLASPPCVSVCDYTSLNR